MRFHGALPCLPFSPCADRPDYSSRLVSSCATGRFCAEQPGSKRVNGQVEVANGQIDKATSRVSVVKNQVAARIAKIEQAFDSRVAGAVKSLGSPSDRPSKACLLGWIS